MKSLNGRPRIAMLLSALVAVGTVVAIAASDSPRALWDALEQIEPQWLAVAFGFELLSYVGYVVAYRSMVLDGEEDRLSLMLVIRLVVAGFGPFVPLGAGMYSRTGCGRCSLRNSGPLLTNTPCWITFSSWRMLPGQGNISRAAIA